MDEFLNAILFALSAAGVIVIPLVLLDYAVTKFRILYIKADKGRVQKVIDRLKADITEWEKCI